MRTLDARARVANVPILVDPARGQNWSEHVQVTLIKANRVEAMADEARPLAMALRRADEHQGSVVVTRGGYGMVAAEREGGTGTCEVWDVCGVGDTVVAQLGARMLAGESLLSSLRVGVRWRCPTERRRYRWELAEPLHIRLLFLPGYSPNLNLVQRLWKFIKRDTLRRRYYADFACLTQLSTPHRPKLEILITLNFQTFENASVMTG